MLWKITDNVKYEEDCEVSWARCSPAPPQDSPGGGGRWTEVGGQGAEAASRHPPLPRDGTGSTFPDIALVGFSGDPFLNRVFS